MSTNTLDREREKLAWLRKKTSEQELWVATLERRTRDDALDAAFERETASVAAPRAEVVQQHTVPQQQDSATQIAQPPLKQLASLTPTWARLFRFIGREGKDGKTLAEFLMTSALPITPDTMRAGLMNYRRDFGLIENPRRGFYVITEPGMKMAETVNERT